MIDCPTAQPDHTIPIERSAADSTRTAYSLSTLFFPSVFVHLIYIYTHIHATTRCRSCSLFSVFQTPTHHQSSVKDQQIEIREKGVGTFGCQVYTGVSGSKARLTCLSCSFFALSLFCVLFGYTFHLLFFFTIAHPVDSFFCHFCHLSYTRGFRLSHVSFGPFCLLILLFPLLLAIVVCRIGSSQCFLPEKGRDTTHLILTRHS